MLKVVSAININRFLCSCDCGNQVEAWRTNLIQGKKTHCGCRKYEGYDLTGQRFGRWTVIGKHNGSVERWDCRCDCGQEGVAFSSHLRHGTSRSCGCLQREAASKAGQNRFRDLTGQRFGKLVVQKLAVDEVNKPKKWLCLCDCGKETVVRGGNLHRTKSCGCLIGRPNLIDLTGQRFGRLVVLSVIERENGKRDKWLCRCDCGKEKAIASFLLRGGITKSCGCFAREIARRRLTVLGLSGVGRERNRNFRLGAANADWVDAVLKRDGHVCQACGVRGFVIAHHKNAWMIFPEQRLDVANGVTACQKCHTDFHSKFGRGKNTEEQWVEFARTRPKLDAVVWIARRKYSVAIGEKYGRLTVVERVANRKGCTWWKCRCDCGNEKMARGGSLRHGKLSSCGCLTREKIREAVKKRWSSLLVYKSA